jgi:nucleoside-diphosphate-sugar epimerase
MNKLNWREALPRIVADFLIVHISMVGAFAASVMYRTAYGHGAEARDLITGFAQHYVGFFWLLSPVFPLVFFLNGFYTNTRGYGGRHKVWVIFRGVALAVMVFFGVNVLLFGQSTVGRSVAVPFAILAGAGLSLARLLKAFLKQHFDVKPKNSASLSKANARVLVVGGGGYIGSLLVERALEKGYHVRVLDCLLYGDEALRSFRDHPNLELMVGDCRNIQDVVRAVRGVESIVHLAAIVGDPACNQDHESALETNYAATRMLIEIAKGHSVSRFVFASSCSVYGATDLEMDETSPVRPISLYGQTKVDSEQALLNAKSESFHPAILRYATVFGLGYRPRFDLVVNLLTAKAYQDGVITIYNGQQWRPFIHVRDLVEATLRVLEAPTRLVSGEVFNIGDSRLNHTLSEVSQIIRGVFPNVRIDHINNSDLRNYRVNFDKIRKLTGFRARYSVKDGVAELKAAFEQGQIVDYLDLRYHNQLFLKAVGSPSHKDVTDALVMAAFSNVPDSPDGAVAASKLLGEQESSGHFAPDRLL